ncbi:MAG: site-specific DNA-methyltransferase [Alphaproteobacteria bacterium]
MDKAGAKHTNWLNMMYPRLLLAHNLLTEDGVIFISIDDNEQANLKKLCDEVFGESNFVACFIWQKNFAPKNDNKYVSSSHEYIFMFAKQKEKYKRILLPRLEKYNKYYKNPDNDPRGVWTSGSMLVTTYNEKYIFKLQKPDGNFALPPEGRCWRYSEDTMKNLIKDNRIYFGKDGNNVPRVKRYLSEMPNGIVPQTILLYDDVGSGQHGTTITKNIMDGKQIFNFPKPTKLIDRLLKISTKENDIILDFFAGSGTTAHSVMQLNAKDGGNRKCISVQLPELTDEKSEAYKSGYKNIAEISKERIRRAGKQIAETNPNVDVGFKVYKLSQSNIKKWNGDFSNIDQDIFAGINRFIDGAKDEDIISELVLKFGLCITENINKFKYNDIQYYTVNGTGGIDLLFVCLSDKISINITDEIIKLKEKHDNIQVVFSDNSFTDCDRSNIEHTLKDSKITRVEFL